MTALVMYGPWDVLPRLHDGIDETAASSESSPAWLPAVDVYEYSDHYAVFVDLPGVDPSKVELMLHEGKLTISGERSSFSDAGEGARLHCQERNYGRFHRTVLLPDTIDADKISASESHGMLRINIAKKAQAMPRLIPVAA